ncbi:hypothetical protein PQR53_22170 [Paraburkholderia fungorum]|uniref:hypothetical protein n=1 Tax=Paraburkholderia fungorum TaxID=134537 RepID=UPI0038BAAF9F
MGFFDLGEQEERSFLSVVRHTVLDGPITLVRFSSSTIQEYGAFGKYWMYGSEILEALENRQVDRLIREIRHRWAISNDWGDLENSWVLHLPEGRQLNAYWGFAKFQPRISAAAARKSVQPGTKSYPGGSIQLVLSIGPEERKYISGPFKTVGLTRATIADY